MALSSQLAPALIEDSSLADWTVIGSGGFGQIFKARHRKWCCDVAIKLLHHDDGTSKSLLREIDMMRQGSSPYVIQVLGIFRGRLPSYGPTTQLGLVMEFMERGSLASLQETLHEAPPWPLVFRLAHQVSLGINFLHSLSPSVLHLDLKPSNVLLDTDLKAKLTDFGLARFYHSVSRISKKDNEEDGGTISYMPPEAFDLSYTPTRASDIYSYGILLWAMVTGKQPYEHAQTNIVRFRIPQGDRPSLDEITSQAAGIAGLTGLMNLMKRCWEAKPKQRPSSQECTTETEELYKMHKHAIVDAVHEVLKKLDGEEEQTITEQVQRVHITQPSEGTGVAAQNIFDNVLTGRPPVQEVAAHWTPDKRDKARVKDRPSTGAPNSCDVDTSRSSANHKEKVSSVHPIHASPALSSMRTSAQSRTATITQQVFRPNLYQQYHRQFSSPEALSRHAQPVHSPAVHIHLSNVTGFQQGNNNTMYIFDPTERKRHPTAPSRVNVPPPHSGNRRNQTGGVG
ncbi:Receptor-interacting serine/threonine-protein kinase 3 [Collichthys lucidus]|uniref:Receptor-interacting serine/threonine-protein kinase 3 n=1 Tax=Collichthys lucidus TaxID=240159 RepID=A0A4U5VWE1_COLLU|nr:Receptor-interacting serine/threonine-protein kinase 3 [Collichthys lucidus]